MSEPSTPCHLQPAAGQTLACTTSCPLWGSGGAVLPGRCLAAGVDPHSERGAQLMRLRNVLATAPAGSPEARAAWSSVSLILGIGEPDDPS